ncbi:transcriptional repressor [bacterium]|nr:transcriptional repressor [bacterium]
MMNEAVRRLKEKGVKVTPQRVAILEYIVKVNDHLTAEEIHNYVKSKFPSISMATVYSTLQKLIEIGEVEELSIKKRGEACFEPKSEGHHHLLCTSCGKILNIALDCPPDCPIIKQSLIKGCKVNEVQAYLYGLCPECLRKEKEEKAAKS